MARILAVTWHGGGNVPPMLGIAGELQRRGHQVRVLGHPQQREAVVSAGLKFVDYHHGRGWSPKVARLPLRFIFGVFTAPGLGTDVRDEIAREPVDLALVDSMILSGLRAAEEAGVPTAVLMHTLHRYHTREWGRGPIGVVAAARGMRPSRLWNAADRVLVATDSALDPATERRLPANVRYTSVVQAPIQPGNPKDRPLVLVSLSTLFFEGQQTTLQAILDALEGLPIRAIVTTGAVAPEDLRVPANAEMHRYIPHDQIMPSVSLIIGHGGSLDHGAGSGPRDTAAHPANAPPPRSGDGWEGRGHGGCRAGFAQDFFSWGDPKRGAVAPGEPVVPTRCGSRRRPPAF